MKTKNCEIDHSKKNQVNLTLMDKVNVFFYTDLLAVGSVFVLLMRCHDHSEKYLKFQGRVLFGPSADKLLR